MSNPDNISSAIAIYIGWNITLYPKESEERLIEEFGRQESSLLMQSINALLAEINAIQIDWSAHTLVSAGALVKDTIKENHPELNKDALDAIEWAFTWWWK